jgi:hypothetical protein
MARRDWENHEVPQSARPVSGLPEYETGVMKTLLLKSGIFCLVSLWRGFEFRPGHASDELSSIILHCAINQDVPLPSIPMKTNHRRLFIPEK